MAGICGLLTFQDRPLTDEGVRGALQALRPRGGVDRIVASGPRIRLAITERPSRTLPPPQTERGFEAAIAVVFDGFLTNAPALRGELGTQHSQPAGDTHGDLIARLYERFGEPVLSRLEGSYAAAVWDARNATLFLIRDPFGARPLFWATLAGGLAFASSIRAVRALGAPAEIDPQSVDDYLSLGYIPAPATIFRAIRKLPAAHLLRAAANGDTRVQRYWDVLDALGDARHPPSGGIEAWKAATWSTLKTSVEKFSHEEKQVGAFLSGGPDSTAVVAALHETGHPHSPAFTIGFRDPDFDESPSARLTVQRFELPYHELHLDDHDGRILPECLRAFDEPYAHPSSVPIYLLSKLASENVEVALGGDGADLLFGGASTYRASDLLASYQRLPRFLRSGLLPWVIEQLPVSHSRAGLRYLARRFVSASEMSYQQAHLAWMEVLSGELKARVYGPRLLDGPAREPVFRLYHGLFDRCRHLARLNQLMYADLNLFLAEDILTKVDRLSAVHGLEVRTPFLDRELTEFCFRLPPEVKVRGAERKYLLRQSLRGRIPGEILRQKKMGFISPASQWLCGAMRGLLEDTLSPAALRQSGWFRPEAVAGILDQHLTRVQDHGRILWSLLALLLWIEDNRIESKHF
jgi:asparagine synthase (glutamine-hydrolysing)